jgi:hypothetical protein
VGCPFGLLVSSVGSALVRLRGCTGGSIALITTNGLRAKWLGKDIWLSDPGVRGGGRLLARITRKGAFFYFQYFSADGRRRPFPLGPFDIQGEQGLSVAAARDRTTELSKLYWSRVIASPLPTL